MTKRRMKCERILCSLLVFVVILGTIYGNSIAYSFGTELNEGLMEISDTIDDTNSEQPEDPSDEIETGETDPFDITEPNTKDPEALQEGSISGSLSTDSSTSDTGDNTDNMVLPLSDYEVSLFDAEDLSAPISQTKTNSNGIYTFDGLLAGEYIVGITSSVVDDKEYLLPETAGKQDKFTFNSETEPETAFSDVIELSEGETVKGMDLTLRTPITIKAFSAIDDIWNKNINDPIDIDSRRWYVVKKLSNYNGSGINYVLLIRQSGDLQQFNLTGNNSNIYSNSELRNYMNKEYDSYATSTIKQIAVVPSLSLSSSSSLSVFSWPTDVLAGSKSQGRDIYFPLSYADMYEVNGNNLSLAPLFSSLPLIVWSRTAASTVGTGNLWGAKRSVGTMDGGLSPASTNVYANPAVWVRTTPLTVNVTVHYIDINGNDIASPSSKIYTVPYKDAFTLNTSEIPSVTDYEYIEWKVGTNGAHQTDSIPIYLSSVTTDTDIYLIYQEVQKTNTLTITKTVTGPMGNKATMFSFIISLFDNTETPLNGASFEYMITDTNGTIIETDILILDENGTWLFSLKHGEGITISGIATDGYFRIVEENNINYESSFIDSEDASSVSVIGNDTNNLVMTLTPRIIDFTNERIYVPETGIKNTFYVSKTIVLVIFGISYLFISSMLKRNRM